MKKGYIKLCLLLIATVLLTACGNKFEAETDWKVENFKSTNQNGNEVSLDNLKGKPWLAMFIFTNCETVCPPMTANMTDVQKAFEKKDLKDYNIVGFSIDPENDSPKLLKKYLAQYPVPDNSKWNLLTGYSQDDIEDLAKKSFQTLVKDDPNSNQVIHGTSFYLVNQEGVVVKSYSGYQNVPIDTITTDMEALIEDGK
ncbi:MAG TPA: SCO family protein [Rummeliibacillus sp.]|nr:SCO family protein [Rummeliibacillus sp.]